MAIDLESKTMHVERLLNRTREATNIIADALKATDNIWNEDSRKNANTMLGDALTSLANLLKSGADTLLELGHEELIVITKPEKEY